MNDEEDKKKKKRVRTCTTPQLLRSILGRQQTVSPSPNSTSACFIATEAGADPVIAHGFNTSDDFTAPRVFICATE